MAAPLLELKLSGHQKQRLSDVQSVFSRAINFVQSLATGSCTVHLDLSGQTLALSKQLSTHLRLLLSCATLKLKLFNGIVSWRQ
jgi:hypothetical protein